MYKIVTTYPSRLGRPQEKREVHVQSSTEATGWIMDVAAEAVRSNREFVFLPDVGASGRAIKFHDGEVVEVIRVTH